MYKRKVLSKRTAIYTLLVLTRNWKWQHRLEKWTKIYRNNKKWCKNFCKLPTMPITKSGLRRIIPIRSKFKALWEKDFCKQCAALTPIKSLIDHFYDTNKQKTAKDVYQQSIVVAKNLQRLGIKKGDIVVFFCMNNEDVAVLTMGCILIGALVNYFEVFMEGGKSV